MWSNPRSLRRPISPPASAARFRSSSWRFTRHALPAFLFLGACAPNVSAQQPPAAAAVETQPPTPLEQKIAVLSAALAATQQQINESQRQMQQLQQELLEVQQQMAATGASSPATVTAAVGPPASDLSTAATLDEREQALEAAVKTHDQIKVESASKYPVRLTGLILFNGFLNRGVVDNTDLPAFALRPTSTAGNGNLGAGLRQTILGIEGDGPRVFGARTSANVSLDFFSSVSYAGYGTSAGVVRMRTGSINLDWQHDSIQVGMVRPLIAPISPDSYATVAEPSLAGAGNLWTWAPQLRYAHRFPTHNSNRLQLELGLWDAPAAGYNSNQLFRTSSPAELSEQPAYESRVSYGSNADHGLELGIGGYYGRQAYPGYQGYAGTENLNTWAGTFDFRLPIGHQMQLSGEGYRGRAIGGLGGGVYKDVITGTNPVTGAPVLHGLNAVGGWTQLKTLFTPTLESNLSIGLDDGFARDFHAVLQPPTASPTQTRARNRMFVANLIFRPKTYIIFSPEYRRVWSWPISGLSSTLDVYTLSLGYQF